MGTRSAIIVELTQEDKDKLQIENQFNFLLMTCQFDGYPTYMGKMLLKHYGTQKKAARLVNKATHVSSVCPTIKETKKYIDRYFKGMNPISEECVYNHWKGCIQNYIYVYRLNEGWRMHTINYRTGKLNQGRLLKGWLNIDDF